MTQIIAAFITGLFLVFVLFVQHGWLSRKRKTEDVAGAVIPRRAELYRDFLSAVCGTGVQYDFENGLLDVKQKIAYLHELCNRSIYELCPFAGENTLAVIMKLSSVCAKHRYGIVNAVNEELKQKWQTFKNEFQFDFTRIIPMMRSDCMGTALDKLIVGTIRVL